MTKPCATISGATPLNVDIERGMRSDRVGKLPAEERRGSDDQIGSAEPLQHEIAQAAADGVADEQRAGQHGHRRGDAQDDRHVGTPVIRQAAKDEPASAASIH